jgi:predicted secreted protein
MGNELSREAKFKYGDNTVGDITSLSLSIDGNVIETNSFDTEEITQAIPGRRTVTASISGNLDRADADGQNAIREDFMDGDNSLPSDFEEWAIEPETPATGDTTFGGACIITGYTEERGDDGDGLATYSVEVRITSFTESVVAP